MSDNCIFTPQAGLGGQATTYVIQTNQLAKTYGEATALKSLNLRIPRHSICGFLGPNGAGKSTALKLLLGLARPTGGNGTIFGHDITHESLAIRRRVGYLAQDPRFYDSMTARNVALYCSLFLYWSTGRTRRTHHRDARSGWTERESRSTGERLFWQGLVAHPVGLRRPRKRSVPHEFENQISSVCEMEFL